MCIYIYIYVYITESLGCTAVKHNIVKQLCVHACVLSCLSCLTLCDPRDHSPPGSSVLGILQARILE